MARLQDAEILTRYHSALANWNVTGYVLWKEVAQEWVRNNLNPLTPREVARLMHEYVESSGEIDQVPERRPEWNDHDFHYDLRIPMEGRLIYVETLLLDDDPMDPIIYVVSIHDA